MARTTRPLRLTAAGLVLAALAACSQIQPVIAPPSPTVISAPTATGAVSGVPVVNRSVAAAGQALAALYDAARVYADLPRCDATSRVLCSDRSVVREIRRRAIQAHNLYVAARRNEENVELAARMWSAVDRLRALVPSG